MRNYQLVLVLKPELTDTQRKKITDSVKGWLKDAKLKEDDWGKKTLSYKIKRELEGYFINFTIEAETVPSDLERKILTQDEIIRHLLIRTKGEIKKAEEKPKAKKEKTAKKK